MSQGPLCPNLSQKVQKEVSQMANRNLSPVILLGGLSVNLNHLKTGTGNVSYNSEKFISRIATNMIKSIKSKCESKPTFYTLRY